MNRLKKFQAVGLLFSLIILVSVLLPEQSQAQRKEMSSDVECSTIGTPQNRWKFHVSKISEVGDEIRWAGGIKKTIQVLNKAGKLVNSPIEMTALIRGIARYSPLTGERYDDDMQRVLITFKIFNPDLKIIETAQQENGVPTYYQYSFRNDRPRTAAELVANEKEIFKMTQAESGKGVTNIKVFCTVSRSYDELITN